MTLSKDERNRILSMLEAGQVNASDAAQLLDALEADPPRTPAPIRARTLRIRATSLSPNTQRQHFMTSMPVHLLKISARLGAMLLPQLSSGMIDDVLHAIEEGATGRLLDIQDLEQGERLEVFVE